MSRLTSLRVVLVRRLYSFIADSISLALLLTGSLIGLLYDGKSLARVVNWRIKLEQALEHGTHGVVDEWPKHGLSYPVSTEKIEIELKKVKVQEERLRNRKKFVIVMFLVLGAFFWFFARYLSTLGY
jgi:hypothetical protein